MVLCETVRVAGGRASSKRARAGNRVNLLSRWLRIAAQRNWMLVCKGSEIYVHLIYLPGFYKWRCGFEYIREEGLTYVVKKATELITKKSEHILISYFSNHYAKDVRDNDSDNNIDVSKRENVNDQRGEINQYMVRRDVSKNDGNMDDIRHPNNN